MNFDYYVKTAVDRLFRYAPTTGRQDRWDDARGTWTNVAPTLADDIYSGRSEMDEVTADRAKRDYPKAFGEFPMLIVDMMNKIQVAIAQKTSLEEFISDYEIPHPEQAAVKNFYADLKKYMEDNPLARGQFWDVASEWG